MKVDAMDGKTLMIPTNGEQANLTAISVVEMIWYVFLPTTLTNVGVVGVLCVVMVWLSDVERKDLFHGLSICR